MIKKILRYVYIDQDVSFRNELKEELEKENRYWFIPDVTEYSEFNTIVKNSNNVENFFIISSDTKKYHGIVLSNNLISTNEKDTKKIIGELHWIMNDSKKEPNIFFISDTHFNHKNIIKYCDRSWNSGKDENRNIIVNDDDVIKMNNDIIENWNSVVGKDDIVYHLGDFALGDRKQIPEIVSRLNGKINLILGNHDWFHIRDKEKYSGVVDFFYKSGFNRVYDKPVLLDNFIILSHEPMSFIKDPFFNVFGHIHNTDTYKTFSKDGCCVCVERWDYKPVSFEKLKEMYEREM